jgi:ATP-dependent Clp protease ATP-binding subunit ClpA
LKRLIQTEVADQLAIRMLEGDFGEGDTVRVAVADDHLTLMGDPRT